MRRKLAFAILNFLIGLLLMYFSIDYGVVSTLVYLGILVLIYKLFLDIDIRYCLFVIAGCIWMLISILGHYNAENMPFVSKEAICRGYVSTESVDKFGLPVYVCEIDEIIFNGMTYNKYKVRLTSKEKQNFSLVGERIEFRAKLDVQEVRDNGIDYRRYLYGKGIDYSSTCRRIKNLKDGGPRLSKIRFTIIKAINSKKILFLSRISPSARGYFSGIIFGEKNLISSDVIEEFQDTGTAHILAVSGLHIGIIYMIFKKLTTRFNLGNRVDFVLILMLGIYIVLASFSISIVRAVLIILLKIIADKLMMRFDFLTAISIAFLISLINNPYSIFDVGLQLSFLSALIIVFIFPHIRRTRHRKLLEIMALPIGLGAYNIVSFGQFSLIAVLANTPVILLISIYVPIGITSFFIYLVSSHYSSILGYLISAIGELTYTVNHSFSLFQKGTLEIEYSDSRLAILLYTFIFIVSSEYFYVKLVSRHDLKQCVGFILIGITIFMF